MTEHIKIHIFGKMKKRKIVMKKPSSKKDGMTDVVLFALAIVILSTVLLCSL